MRIVLPKIARLRKPQFYKLDGQTYLYVPILNEDKEDKAIGADYIISFLITSKGPSREGRAVYCAPGLDWPSYHEIRHWWKQAYAVWRNTSEKEKAGAAP